MAKAILTVFVVFPAFLWGWAEHTVLGQVVVLVYAVAVAAWHVLTDARYRYSDTLQALWQATMFSLLRVLPAWLLGRALGWFVPF